MVPDCDRLLGRYMTPAWIAQLLTRWALLGQHDPLVLDPCFGEAVFLKAAVTALGETEMPAPASRVFGADISQDARRFLRDLLDLGVDPSHFAIADYFRIKPSSFGVEGFSAIVGNPPYVRHHFIPRDMLETARDAVSLAGFVLPRVSSYWAYFALHSVGLLRKGGRLALVLPESFLQADYAAVVRHALRSSFAEVLAVSLDGRLFTDVQESTVLLLASGKGERNMSYAVESARSYEAVQEFLGRVPPANLEREAADASGAELLIDPCARDSLRGLAAKESVIRLGDWATVRIGVVTGANNFFVVSPELAEKLSCLESVPIIARTRMLGGIRFGATDLEALESRHLVCRLLQFPQGATLAQPAQDYIQQGISRGLNTRHHCLSRSPWYQVAAGPVPSAFLTYMAGMSPRVIVNETKATCTNAVHRLSWRVSRDQSDWLRVAVGALSTLTRLSAEIEGRTYGGGVLKLEPSEARRLLVPLPEARGNDVLRLAREVDSTLRERGLAEATALVDREVLVGTLGLDGRQHEILRRALQAALQRRQLRHTAAHGVWLQSSP